MRVQDIMTINPAFCTAETNLQDVVRMMVANDCGCIPVVDGHDNRHVLGVITDRDICVRTIADGKNPLELSAHHAMTHNVMTVTPQTHIDDLVKRMEEWKVRRAPVVDEQGNLLGMVSQADIALSATPHVDEMVKEVSEPNRSI